MTSRSRRRRWPRESPAGAPAVVPPPDSGVIVTCGDHRVMEAGFRVGDPGTLWYAGRGHGAVYLLHDLHADGARSRTGLVWRHMPRSDGPGHMPSLTFGCPDHGQHAVDLARVLEVLDRLRPRPGRNWPRVSVADVAAAPNRQ